MKVSLNWIRDINSRYKTSAEPAVDGIDKLVERIGAQLGAVEEVIDLGKKYQGVVIAKVVTCARHPNADKLSLCMIDDGGKTKNIDRNSEGFVQVVCGAPNVKANMLVAWIPPGYTVPATFSKDPFVLEAREIRGQISNGMLASASELAISEDHSGILEVDEPAAKPGDDFAKVYGLDDYIIDIENKMFTHRPDCFGLLGVAREVAGIQHHKYKSPDWYLAPVLPQSANSAKQKTKLDLEVDNKIPDLVPRFCALAIKDVQVKPSPIWLQALLSSLGVRSINNIVDLTNYFMLLTGQPLHAYDYDKVALLSTKKAAIVIRKAKQGEKLGLLGGKEIKLSGQEIVIATDKQAIGLGGVMGGAGTEVGDDTKNIILECASFDMYTIRRTSMAHGLFTDAATRFTKGQSPLQNLAVIAKAAEDILALAGGRIAGKLVDVVDCDKIDVDNDQWNDNEINITPEFINVRLGLNLSAAEIIELLENVEFGHDNGEGNIRFYPPFWRTDIEIREDIVEEVGRLYGYDHLPLELPKRDLTPAKKDEQVELKSRIRSILTRAGGNEVLTYSFVHGDLLERTGQDKNLAFKIANALSPDLQYYRLSLMPSLLSNVHSNIKAGFDSFALYEINKVHSKTETDKDGLPIEFERVALVLADKNKKPSQTGAPFFAAKLYAQTLLDEFGVDAEYHPLNDDLYTKKELFAQMAAPFEPAHSAAIMLEDKLIGVVGEYKASVAQKLKLPNYCAGFELSVSALSTTLTRDYQPLNRYPQLEQDFCLRYDAQLPYSKLTRFMKDQIASAANEHGYRFDVAPLDIFQREDDKLIKQTTWRIKLWHPARTLTTKEVNKLLDQIASAAKEQLNAERI